MLIYGFHPVREALRRHPGDVVRVLVAPSRGGGRRREVEGLCRRSGVTLSEAPGAVLAQLAGAVHNGFVAELRESRAVAAGGDPDLRVLCEDVQDPRNLGALMRVCEGAGVGRLLIRDRGSAPLTATVAKTSAGAADWLPVERIPNPARALAELKGEGFWVYGLVPGGEPPWRVDLTGKVLLCFGGEEKGLRRLTRERCDRLLGLPMRGRVESLNLATAAAAVLYEAVRQRWGAPTPPPLAAGEASG